MAHTTDILDKLNSLDHFEFHFDELEQGYVFHGAEGHKYIVSFPEYPILGDAVYMLNIDRQKSANKTKSTGNQLRNTIFIILSNFFANKTNSLVAICEIKDSHQYARHRLFNRWLRQSRQELDIRWLMHIDAPFTLSDQTENFAMFYYHKDNENIQLILEQFNDILLNKFYME